MAIHQQTKTEYSVCLSHGVVPIQTFPVGMAWSLGHSRRAVCRSLCVRLHPIHGIHGDGEDGDHLFYPAVRQNKWRTAGQCSVRCRPIRLEAALTAAVPPDGKFPVTVAATPEDQDQQ